MKLTDLNVDCLLHIFSFCSEKDLRNLCYASRFLNDIIDENVFYNLSKDLLMCGHRNFPEIKNRTQITFSYGDRLTVARNWINGCYTNRPYFHHRQMFATKLFLERSHLFVTHAAYIRKYSRIRKEPLDRRYVLEISTSTKSDIADFIKKRNTIFAGRVCGLCFVYDDDGIRIEQRMHPAKEYLHCVDFVDNLYVTSSDSSCKIWQRAEEFELVHFDLTMQLRCAFKSLKLSNDGRWLFGGLYTDVSRQALRAINIERGEEFKLKSNTRSIYDIKIKDEHTLYTANFDTTFRIYDRRLDQDVAQWVDPFDSSFYCVEHDGLYAVLCGTKYNSRVNLYDIRMTGKYVQLYFPSYRRNMDVRSPVYCIACDSQFLFVATDHNIHVFDFKNACSVSRDYRNIFSEIYRI